MCKVNQNNLKKPTTRQWSKWLSNNIAVGLVNAVDKSPLIKSYWNTFHCAEVVQFNEKGKGISSYCKNRWCYTCSRIRTAKMIKDYLPELQKFKDAHFVTLTRPTCKENELSKRLQEMQEVIRKINKSNSGRFKKYNGTDLELKGIRKLECTLRPDNKYHPHYHLIVNTKEQADRIVELWLSYNPDADSQAQNIRKADERSHKELFKYFTKLNESKRKNGEALSLNYKRLDVIFQAMKGRVVYQSFGKLRKVNEDFNDEDLEATTNLGNDYANMLFTWIEDDWICKETGESLIGKTIPEKVKRLIPQKVAEKEMIEQTNYLPPLKEFGSTADAFDDARPVIRTVFDVALQSFRSVEEIRSVLKPTIKHNQLKIELE